MAQIGIRLMFSWQWSEWLPGWTVSDPRYVMPRARGLATPPHTSSSSFPLTPFDLAICQHWGLLCLVSLCVPDCSVQAILRGTILAGSQVSLGHTCGCRVFFSCEMDPYYSLISLSLSLSNFLSRKMDRYCQILSLSLSLALPYL